MCVELDIWGQQTTEIRATSKVLVESKEAEICD